MRNSYDAFADNTQHDDGTPRGRRHGFGHGGEGRPFARRGGGPMGGRGSRGGFGRDDFDGAFDDGAFDGSHRHGDEPDEHHGEGRGFERDRRGFAGRGGFDGPFGGGFGPGFDDGFDGPFGGRGRGPRGGRGPGRGRRGDVRAAILALLAEEPMNGYGLIGAIAAKSDGLWKPGAGSVYPALGLLEDEGLITPDVDGRKKVYSLTDEGRTYVTEHADEVNAPWERVARPHAAILDLRPELHQLGMALRQVTAAGDQAQVDAARAILERARKDVYRLLAGDMPAAAPADASAEAIAGRDNQEPRD